MRQNGGVTHSSLPFDASLGADVARKLAQLDPVSLPPNGLKRAAVCLILTSDPDGNAAVVLTLRSTHIKRHANQFAFPGGRVDPGETAIDAALRETHEEVGLVLARDAVIGTLDDFATRSGYLITPVVVWAPAAIEMRANPDEVAAIYRVPLSELMQVDVPQFVRIPESDRPVIRYPLLGTLIHAPTAALLYQLIEVAVYGRATRVAHLEQPVWAWS